MTLSGKNIYNMKNLVKITIGAGVGGIADGIRRKIPAAMQALEGEII